MLAAERRFRDLHVTVPGMSSPAVLGELTEPLELSRGQFLSSPSPIRVSVCYNTSRNNSNDISILGFRFGVHLVKTLDGSFYRASRHL